MSGEFAPSRVMPLVKAMGAPDAGNPHVRCDEGGGGAFTPPPYSTGEVFFSCLLPFLPVFWTLLFSSAAPS